ncbi:MAG: alpha/beta fold hydrolase [Patescibacteria group bacterium]|nr:alpha/beta fold hydrolase [Patescibacteria group bacterium]
MSKLFKKRGVWIVSVITLIILISVIFFIQKVFTVKKFPEKTITPFLPPQQSEQTNPLQISQMRSRSYPGSDIAIEQTLADGSNYHQYIASYLSDGLKIYGLFTVPEGQSPPGGWPVIIFNHGYIPPEEYRPTERYIAYVDSFARRGYIVFKPDYRGNGNSEGQPEGAYYSPAYTVDVLNALSSIKKFKGVNPDKIGMWGHSMGGNITLRSLVISSDIKAAVIWGGVVGTYDDLMNNWTRKVPYVPSQRELALRNRNRENLIAEYGTPSSNPTFWHSIDPNFNLQYVQAPVQLDVGLSDEEVPWQFSEGLKNRLEQSGKVVEYYTYPGANHNISSPSFETAMARSVTFFDKYLK